MRSNAVVRAGGWLLAAVVSGWAAHLAVQYDTPIDRALPLLAVAITFVAAVTWPALQVAVPMLIAAETALPDETTRLQAFGVIVAATFGLALAFTAYRRSQNLLLWGAGAVAGAPSEADRIVSARGAAAAAAPHSNSSPRDTTSYIAALVVTIAAIVILRWIPMPMLVLRELLLLVLAAAIVAVLRATPFAVVIAIATALYTPAVPLRTLGLPLAVLGLAALARFVGMPRLRLTVVSAAILGVALLFFPWSGVLARTATHLLNDGRTAKRDVVNAALAPGRSVEVDVPANATSMIVSGANVARLERGARLGRVEPGGIEIRVGDAADWGYARRSVFYGSRNPLPANPAGVLRDYGYEAWVDGAGRIGLPCTGCTIRVTSDVSLPPDAALQVEGFEIAQ